MAEAWEAAHAVTGHVRGTSAESEATDSVGSEPGSMVAPVVANALKKDSTVNETNAGRV